MNERVFDQGHVGPRLSLMDIIRSLKEDWQLAQFHNLNIDLGGGLLWDNRQLKGLMVCVEYRRKVVAVDNRFFAYDEEYPEKGRHGLCLVSKLKWTGSRR